ncbi:MAG: hypothetical protein AB8B60_18405 [Sulfitobacter sp.]
MRKRAMSLSDLKEDARTVEERIAAFVAGSMRVIKHPDGPHRRNAIAQASAERDRTQTEMESEARRDAPTRKLWAALSDAAKIKVGFMCAEGDVARGHVAAVAPAEPGPLPPDDSDDRKLLELENMTACLVLEHPGKMEVLCPNMPKLRLSEVERGHPADNLTWDDKGCAHGLDLFTPPDVATSGKVATWGKSTKSEFILAYAKHCKNGKSQKNTSAEHDDTVDVIGLLDVTDYEGEERAALMALLEPKGLRALKAELNPEDESELRVIHKIDSLIPAAEPEEPSMTKTGKGNCIVLDRKADGEAMIVSALYDNPIDEDPDATGEMELFLFDN